MPEHPPKAKRKARTAVAEGEGLERALCVKERAVVRVAGLLSGEANNGKGIRVMYRYSVAAREVPPEPAGFAFPVPIGGPPSPPAKTTADLDCLVNLTAENLPKVATIVAKRIGDLKWVTAAAKKANVSPNFVAAVARVAHGTLHPKLLWEKGTGITVLWRMPLSIQEQCLEGRKVKLLLQLRDATWQTVDVDPITLSSRQAKQVFDMSRGAIRTVEEQRAWFDSSPCARPLRSAKRRRAIR